MAKNYKKKYIFPFNRHRAIFALVNSVILSLLMFTGLVMRLLSTLPAPAYYGTGAFRMFTIDSNCLVGICATLAIPYQIDGIRTGNYRMPKWIIYTLYVGVSAVTLTMMTTLFILAPFSGFDVSLFTNSNLIFHIINPIMSIILFIFVTCEHKVKLKYTFVAMAPVFLYALVYMIMVFFIGESNGGWADHYKFGAYIPWPLSLLIMLAFAFGICTALRVLHNLVHKAQEERIKKNYQDAMVNHQLNAEDAVKLLAEENISYDPFRAEVIVPRQVICAFMEKNNGGKSLEELSDIYLKEYLKIIEDLNHKS